jgi:hypothetical protein
MYHTAAGPAVMSKSTTAWPCTPEADDQSNLQTPFVQACCLIDVARGWYNLP